MIAVVRSRDDSIGRRFAYAASALCDRIGLVLSRVPFDPRGPVVWLVHGEPDDLPEGAFALVVPDCGVASGTALTKPRRVVAPGGFAVPVSTHARLRDGEPLIAFDDGSPAATLARSGGRDLLFLGWDAIGETFFHLSRAEESSAPKDEHGRVRPESSVLFDHLSRPVVDLSAALVSELLSRAARLAGRPLAALDPWPSGRGWAAAVSHDVDLLGVWRTRHAAGETLRGLRDIAGGRFERGARRSGEAMVGWLTRRDPSDTFERVRAVERRFDVRSTFHLFGGGRDPHDRAYYVRWRKTKRRARALVAEGCEVALHGSYNGHVDAGVMKRESRMLARVVGAPILGTRQHYLRYDPAATPAAHEAAGFVYDSSLGYAQVSGFRAGTGVPFHPWGLSAGRTLGHFELPLAVMDSTCLLYGDGDVRAHVGRAVAMCDEVRRAGGCIAILWHTEAFDEKAYPGYSDGFRDVVSHLRSNGAWTPTQAELVEYRTGRAGLRVESVEQEPDGWKVVLRADRDVRGITARPLAGVLEGGEIDGLAGSTCAVRLRSGR